MPEEKRIIILGGGFGGVRAAIDLVRAGHTLDGYEIVLIDRAPHHLYTPLLYEVPSVFFADAKARKHCVACGVAISFDLLSATSFQNRVRIITGDVTAIDTANQQVLVGTESLAYSYLILGIGAEVETFGIPGIEHAKVFRTLDDAAAMHNRVEELLREKRNGTEQCVRIVIGGGGPTGVELAGELAMYGRHTCAKYGLSHNDFSITLVEANNRLVKQLHPKISDGVRERLEALGITIWLDTCVKEVQADAIRIAPRPLREGESPDALLCDFGNDHDKLLEADMVIWSGGVRSPALLTTSGLLLNSRGRVDVYDTMQAKGNDRVFAIGDCAVLLDPRTGLPVPGLAQVAIFQGNLAARNIIRSVLGRPLAHYEHPFLAHIIPLGGKYAFGEFGPIRTRGMINYFLRRLVDLKYFLSILPVWHALGIWWMGWKEYGGND